MTSGAGQLPTAICVTRFPSSFVSLVVEDVRIMTSRAPPVPAAAAEDALLAHLFTQQATSLVRLARFFVDDRAAVEEAINRTD
jgi:hypothetical protein